MNGEMAQEAYFVYILRCGDGSLYTGVTTDLARRLEEHKSGTGGRYTRSHGVEEMLYSELAESRGAALRREVEIKSWSREKKLALVAGTL